jgi:hypothetical protein
MSTSIFGYAIAWQTDNLGAGANSHAFLPVNMVAGDPRTDLLQVQNNGGQVSMTAFTPAATGGGYAQIWHNGNMSQRLGKSTFLTGRFPINGLTEVVQISTDTGRLGMVIYNATDRRDWSVFWSSADMGSASSTLAFLAADVDGSGKTSLIVLYDNGGRLGATVYSPAANSTFTQVWHSDTLGENSSALQFFAADVNGDGKDEIIQLGDVGGKLAMNVFTSDGRGAYARSWGSAAVGPSSKHVAFLKADMTGDKNADIVQLQDNGGMLGMAVYSPTTQGSYALAWSSASLSRPSAAIQFLALDVNGDGKDEIVQLGNTGGNLTMSVYASDGRGGYAPSWGSASLGHTAAALAFIPGSGGVIFQVCTSATDSSRLGLVVYSPKAM